MSFLRRITPAVIFLCFNWLTSARILNWKSEGTLFSLKCYLCFIWLISARIFYKNKSRSEGKISSMKFNCNSKGAVRSPTIFYVLTQYFQLGVSVKKFQVQWLKTLAIFFLCFNWTITARVSDEIICKSEGAIPLPIFSIERIYSKQSSKKKLIYPEA